MPTDAEWTILTTYLGGESVAGGPMKEAGTTHWASPNTAATATNSSGFTALLGGSSSYDGTFYSLTYHGFFWSASEHVATDAWGRNLYYGNANVYRDWGNKSRGLSVRCLQN